MSKVDRVFFEKLMDVFGVRVTREIIGSELKDIIKEFYENAFNNHEDFICGIEFKNKTDDYNHGWQLLEQIVGDGIRNCKESIGG